MECPLLTLLLLKGGSEREQIFPLLDSVKLKTLKPGNPKRKVKILAADKGYDSKSKRLALRKRRIRPQLPKRNYKTKKNLGRPIKISVPRFQQERCFARASKMQVVVLSSDGNVKKLTLMPSYFWLLFTFGLINY